MNRLSVMTILLASSVVTGVAADAKTIYVDGSRGDDTVTYANNGADRPWRSLGRALWGSSTRTAPVAAEAARPGDVVIVAAGVYETTASTGRRYDPIYNPVNSGTAEHPITIRAESPGSVSLRSTQSSDSQPIIGSYGRSNLVWDGFLVDERYVPTRADTGPVVVWDSTNVTLQNLTIRGYNRGWSDNHNGIRIEQADNIVIRNNLISGYTEDQQGQGMKASAVTMYHTQRAVVENNEIFDANAGVYVKGVVSGPITIRKNVIHGTTVGIYFGGVGTATASNGARAYSNVIYDASLAGVGFIGYDSVSPSNVVVANNTIVMNDQTSDGGAILFRPGFDGYRNIRVQNNVLGRSRNAITAWENRLEQIASSYNAFYQNTNAANVAYTAYQLPAWQSQFGRDTVGSTQVTNPGFQNESGNDFRLAAGSPLLGAGSDILDLNGNGSTSDRINIGAYAIGDEVIGRTTSGGNEPPTQPRPPDSVNVG